MAFNPIANRNRINPIPALNKTFNKPTEIKKEVEVEINHKANIYKILKTNQKLTQEELVNLTNLLDGYFKKYMS